MNEHWDLLMNIECIIFPFCRPMVHHTVNFEDACTALSNLHQFTVGNVVLVM